MNKYFHWTLSGPLSLALIFATKIHRRFVAAVYGHGHGEAYSNSMIISICHLRWEGKEREKEKVRAMFGARPKQTFRLYHFWFIWPSNVKLKLDKKTPI